METIRNYLRFSSLCRLAALIILFNHRPRMRVFSRRLIHTKRFLSRRSVAKAAASLAKRSPPHRVETVANETAVLRKIIPLCIAAKWLSGRLFSLVRLFDDGFDLFKHAKFSALIKLKAFSVYVYQKSSKQDLSYASIFPELLPIE